MTGKSHTIKIAAYKKFSPSTNVDWTLDCLKNIFKPEHVTLDNDNFITYYNQVKYFNPDLIISDMEYYTSQIANSLGVTLWQCSSSLINYSLSNRYKYGLGIFKKYAYLFNRNAAHTQRVMNLIDNSNRNFVYSHFGDCETPPEIKSEFEWIRPYHTLGMDTLLCQHNVVAGMLGNNKQIISLLKQYEDSVCFTEFLDETYSNPMLKDIRNAEEFACNLRNSRIFVCAGQTSLLSNAFYNTKPSVVLMNMDDPECVVNATISEKLGLSKNIYQIKEDLSEMDGNIAVRMNENIKYLHERIEEL